MLCERFHKRLKHDILEGEANVRIDSLINILISFVMEMEEDREIMWKRCKKISLQPGRQPSQDASDNVYIAEDGQSMDAEDDQSMGSDFEEVGEVVLDDADEGAPPSSPRRHSTDIRNKHKEIFQRIEMRSHMRREEQARKKKKIEPIPDC
ncbi:hypothetical protein OESDEN_01911 [Oesophagostomum dentatum]|uniref:Uncharacterized protein n=1 Tax=Oesophagostomum dentatum TaxID=61180 RepID=A0A0B1TPT5_OESDE|nr:hypothetical protein OESDEN_01911 [Oesophagostomum dentatum]